MLELRLTAFVLLVLASLNNASLVNRTRRSIRQLEKLIKCETDRDPRDFINYGCWCGIGGSGNPVDQTDECCNQHDVCYDDLLDAKVCQGVDIYMNYYPLPPGYKDECPTLSDAYCNGVSPQHCVKGLCKCDIALSNCLRNSEFDEKYKAYSGYVVGCSVRGVSTGIRNCSHHTYLIVLLFFVWVFCRSSYI